MPHDQDDHGETLRNGVDKVITPRQETCYEITVSGRPNSNFEINFSAENTPTTTPAPTTRGPTTPAPTNPCEAAGVRGVTPLTKVEDMEGTLTQDPNVFYYISSVNFTVELDSRRRGPGDGDVTLNVLALPQARDDKGTTVVDNGRRRDGSHSAVVGLPRVGRPTCFKVTITGRERSTFDVDFKPNGVAPTSSPTTPSPTTPAPTARNACSAAGITATPVTEVDRHNQRINEGSPTTFYYIGTKSFNAYIYSTNGDGDVQVNILALPQARGDNGRVVKPGDFAVFNPPSAQTCYKVEVSGRPTGTRYGVVFDPL